MDIIKTIIGVAIVGLIVWVVWGWLKPTDYTGYFYYNPNDLSSNWQQPGLKSLDDCRIWVNSQVQRDYDGLYDYECGKNCKHDGRLTAAVCETTER